jgi:hypothetical protein
MANRRTITSSNIIFFLLVEDLLSNTQIQGYAPDEIFDFGDIPPNEALMGADGLLAAGKIFTAVKQKISLQANSLSVDFFDVWKRGEDESGDSFLATGYITIPSLGMSYTCTGGVLTMYKPVPAAKKVLQPSQFEITWEKVVPSKV